MGGVGNDNARTSLGEHTQSMNAQLNGVVVQTNHRDIAWRHEGIGMPFTLDAQPPEINAKAGGTLNQQDTVIGHGYSTDCRRPTCLKETMFLPESGSFMAS